MQKAADDMRYSIPCVDKRDRMPTDEDADKMMCYIQLSLLGCAGYVHVGNTLTEPMTGHELFGDGGENTWYTPMFYAEVWGIRRQAAIMRHAMGMNERVEGKTPEEQLMMEI